MSAVENAVLLDAASTVGVAREKLAQRAPGAYVAVRRQAGVVIFWYVFTVGEALARMQGLDAGLNLVDGLDLHETKAARPGAQPGVVLDGNRFLGVRPAHAAPEVDLAGVAALATTLGAGHGTAPKAGPPPPAPREEEFRAYPSLNAPRRVAPAQEFELIVALGREQDPETPAGPVVVALPEGLRQFALDVRVIADGFTAPQGWRHRLDVDRDDLASARITVPLIAPRDVAEARVSEIIVTFAYKGMSCGWASRSIEVVAAGTQPYADTRGTGVLWSERSGAAVAMHVAPDLPPIDLTVNITKPDGNAASGKFKWTYESPHLPKETLDSLDDKAPDLGADAAAFAQKLIDSLREVDGKATLGLVLDGVAATVKAKVPPDFWRVLRIVWDAVRAQKPQAIPSVLLATAEPCMPWELARVDPPLDPACPSYLGAQVAIARWPLGGDASSPPLPPPARIHVENMAVVVGNYLYTTELKHAKAEGALLEKRYGAAQMDAALGNIATLLTRAMPEAQAVHFACHGEIDTQHPMDAAIILSDGTRLEPLWLRETELGRRHGPLLFLNACNVGNAGQALATYSGFAGECLKGGFRAFVAPLWAIDDDIAAVVAGRFYEGAFGDAGQNAAAKPVAEILRELRGYFNPDSDRKSATWLAYVFYGHPGLRLSRA